METVTRDAAFLEEAVCNSNEKELHVYCHAQSGRGWVEVGGRRFMGHNYVQAARKLQEHHKLQLKTKDAKKETFELGHHSCSKSVKA